MSESHRRWQLLLGRLSNPQLDSGGFSKKDLNRQQALDYIYHRAYQRRGFSIEQTGSFGGKDRQGGKYSDSAPEMLDWLSKLPSLFPKNACEKIAQDAIERFEMTELLKDPKIFDKIEPNESIMQAMMLLKGKLSNEVLQQLRALISLVVEQIKERIKMDIDNAFSGRRNRFKRSFQSVAANLDWQRTLRDNIKNYDINRQKLVINQLYFNSRVKQRFTWDVILCVDQSGSMASSVIYSAVMAGILSSLPAVNIKLLVFDTRVVDLTHVADDPVETLMTVQLGGGTDIGTAMQYCESIVTQPERTVVTLISDFYEGGPESTLLASVSRLNQLKVKQLGLASLEPDGQAEYDKKLAGKLAFLGMNVGAMTPNMFADWLAEVMN